MRIHYRKIGGLHFIRFGRYQLSACRLRAPRDFASQPRASRASHASLDSTKSPRVMQRVTRFLQSDSMREARTVEGVLMRVMILPVILIWSVTLIEAADRFSLF